MRVVLTGLNCVVLISALALLLAYVVQEHTSVRFRRSVGVERVAIVAMLGVLIAGVATAAIDLLTR